MVEEILVKPCLSEKMIEAGRKVVIELTENGFPPYSAAWVFSLERTKWLLVLALENEDGAGEREAYEVFYDFVKNNPDIESKIGFFGISFVNRRDAQAQAFRKIAGTLVNAEGKTFAGPVKNGPRVEDSYIYRITQQSLNC